MNLFKRHRNDLLIFVCIVLLGQIVFALMSPAFTAPCYEGRIFATTGVRHKQEDLHKLNEAAHYFGQTMIGWLKFPSFYTDLSASVPLPTGSSVSAHIQERQNIIFSVNSPEPIELETLKGVKDFMQGKLDDYNSVNQTEFVLTNTDYESVEIKKSYRFGAALALLSSVVLSAAILFIRHEFRRA